MGQILSDLENQLTLETDYALGMYNQRIFICQKLTSYGSRWSGRWCDGLSLVSVQPFAIFIHHI